MRETANLEGLDSTEVAEREGLPRRSQKLNKIRHFLQARGSRVYQSCAPKSSRGGVTSPSKPTSSLPRETDIRAVSVHVSNVPEAVMASWLIVPLTTR
jgi:hypothetical protein